jgi:hypothetical protein
MNAHLDDIRLTNHGPVLNAMSVDVEDWLQSTIDPELPFPGRFIRSTEPVLEAFARRGVRGTSSFWDLLRNLLRRWFARYSQLDMKSRVMDMDTGW